MRNRAGKEALVNARESQERKARKAILMINPARKAILIIYIKKENNLDDKPSKESNLEDMNHLHEKLSWTVYPIQQDKAA